MIILVLNIGSSSVKFAVFEARDPGLTPHLLARGAVERASSLTAAADVGEADLELVRGVVERAEAAAGGRRIDVAAHRVVHGGRRFAGPVWIDPVALDQMRELSSLAPLHQPHNLMGVAAIERLRPGVRQAAGFDTAFHRTQPEARRRLPLPQAWFDDGLERYGFHGLSYAWVARALARRGPPAPSRVLAYHLGSGASACALLDGRSQATSMGFSTLDGLMMGTRPGNLDPGVLLHLMAQGQDAAALQRLLYTGSGLVGVSGQTADMRALLSSPTPQAGLAVEMFCNSAAAVGAGLVTALGGLDAIVFTGGIGENAAPVRAAIIERLGFLGAAIDAGANAAHRPDISAPGSGVDVLIVPADEERMIALSVIELAQADETLGVW